MEQHLLSLYRKAFEQQLSPMTPSTIKGRVKSPPTTPRARLTEFSTPEVLTKRGCSTVQYTHQELDTLQKECNGYELETPEKEYSVHQPDEKHSDSSVHRCRSSVSQCSAFTTRGTPTSESLTDSLRACHSQPLSMMEVNHIS